MLCRQMVALPLAKFLLCLRGLSGALQQLCIVRKGTVNPGLPAGMSPVDYAQRCAALTGIAARHGLFPGNCLPQALVLQDLLHRRGLAAELRIGVLPGSNPLQAHAWVELEGVPLGANPPAGYHIIEKFDWRRLQNTGTTRYKPGPRS